MNQQEKTRWLDVLKLHRKRFEVVMDPVVEEDDGLVKALDACQSVTEVFHH
jgi:hypothetical protein